MTRKKIVLITIAAVAVVVTLLLLRAHRLKLISVRQSIEVEGAVIRSDTDVNKELPIADVAITASDGVASATTRSDASGYFKLALQKGV